MSCVNGGITEGAIGWCAVLATGLIFAFLADSSIILLSDGSIARD
jgi:hypothetical protein